jgi:hypothetical protein
MTIHRCIGLVTVGSLAVAGPAWAARTLTRNVEPVVVTGTQAPALSGVDVAQMVVFAYAEASGTWAQIPFQVDERTPGGDYFAADDGLWDANDEIVVVAQDCGDQAPPTAWAGGTFQTSRYEIAVTDPLTGNAAWAYLYTAPSVTPVGTNYMAYSGTATNTITGTAYQIDFLDGKANIQTQMAVLPAGGGDGVDLIDRAKSRVKVLLFTYTEDDLVSTIQGVKLGPVRFIERFTSKLTGFDALDATAFYYPAFIRTSTTIISTFFDINFLRYTMDFNHNAGPMTHYDDSGVLGANGPLTVDGITDALSLTPLGLWWEVDSPHGCYILVSDYTQAPAQSIRFWYQDGGTDPHGATGSGGLWGECGVYATDAQNTRFTVDSWSFMLPANSGNVGAIYESYYVNRLSLTATSQAFVTSVAEIRAPASVRAAVHAAQPSPFVQRTAIPVDVFDAQVVAPSVQVLAPTGRAVRTMPLAPRIGRNVVLWDGRDDAGRPAAPGVYVYRVVERGGRAISGSGRVVRAGR